MSLTDRQKEIITVRGRNVLVSAGAGTGKTHVLVERFLEAVISEHVPVTEILALTFTEKAAHEMKKRIRKALLDRGLHGPRRDLESAYISTIHAFAARVLKEHPLEAGVDPDFRVLKEDETGFLKESVYEELLEKSCETKAAPTLELLRAYGEDGLREGVLRVFHSARHEGKNLAEFFELSRQKAAEPPESPAALFDELGEKELLGEWRKFEKAAWDWAIVEAFEDWCCHFGKRGGARLKDRWKKVSELCRETLHWRLEQFAIPWKERFEALALCFEEAYEARKEEIAGLDFDDLQKKAAGLFKNPSALSQRLRARYREKFRYLLVDEFQDTNRLQLDLVELLSSGNNLFLVGDFKQSIYGFRGARPDLFLEQHAAYAKAGHTTMDLVENFRSEPAVLDFVNGFCRHLWEEDGLKVRDLVPTVPATEDSAVEWLVTEREEGEDLPHARLREADAVANRIAALCERGTSYGDIAILFQAMTNTALYEQALKRLGIPYFVAAGRTFYTQPEIRDVLQFLSYLDNPLEDIPLAASLRSPLGQISDNTLFWLARGAKKESPKRPLYEGLKNFETLAEIPETEKIKLREFCRVSQELLEARDRLRLTELLHLLLSRTSLELIMLADPGGVRRYANLKKLLSIARQWESQEILSIGSFLGKLRRLEQREARESEAQVESEEGGKVVRLLSIHKAKGLEFPVVFLADLAYEPPDALDSKDILAEPGAGYALRLRYQKTAKKKAPAGWIRINDLLQEKRREERKRLFYVAATRAKKKLILSGVQDGKKTEKTSYREMATWMEWLAASPAEAKSGLKTVDGQALGPVRPKLSLAQKARFQKLFPDLKPRPVETWIRSAARRRETEAAASAILRKMNAKPVFPARAVDLPVSALMAYRRSPELYKKVYEIGYPDICHVDTGHGSPLKACGDDNSNETLPSFPSNETLPSFPGLTGESAFGDDAEESSAADFGTAVHGLLEKIDFKNPQGELETLLSERRGILGADGTQKARQLLNAFFKTPLFSRLREAKAVKKEIPFILNGRHGLISGVIDVLFQDARGDWHILDYKTAVGSESSVQSHAYDLQLEFYLAAVHKLTGVLPASGLLYFLINQWEYEKRVEKSKIADLQSALDKLQEEILNFRVQSGAEG